MKTAKMPAYRRVVLEWLTVVFLAAFSTAYATTHIIHFSGSFGQSYSPNSLDVSIGDTIKWEGDFSSHPLSSTTVPLGAQSFSQSSGTAFIYVITAAGTYLYHCDFHFSEGMTGSFTASGLTDVNNLQTSINPYYFRLNQNYPNPFNPKTVISYQLSVISDVKLSVYDVLGREVAALINSRQNAGIHTMLWNAQNFPSGTYFYRLQAGSYADTKKLIILK